MSDTTPTLASGRPQRPRTQIVATGFASAVCAMMMAGAPCPYKGKIGKDALVAWKKNPDDVPSGSTSLEEDSYVDDVPVPPLPSDLPSKNNEKDILYEEWDGE